ncbi:MAG: benzoate/H(+) symporter BenE family transporter [Solirubrobacteraceae bacterium]
MRQPIFAGVVAAFVGFASSFTVVLAGLREVGATQAQAASALFAVCVIMGVLAAVLSHRLRMPISIAWSTPGAALLVATGPVDGGFPAAVGAFIVCGLLLALVGTWGTLGLLIARIPVPLASAMLAAVVFELCLAPVRAAVELPLLAAPVIVTWLVLNRLAKLWAVPAALVVAIAAVLIDRPVRLGGELLPHPVLIAPEFTIGALVSIALPLFVVTMASQNIPGMGVLASFGYRPPLRPLLVGTGLGTAVGAPFGAHAVNLAAITAALMAGPDAHPDPRQRWIAPVASGVAYLVLALAAGVATAFVTAAPEVIVEAVAGLALLGVLGAALHGAVGDARHREAAVITLVVGASGITAAGIGAPFWGLVAGLAYSGWRAATAGAAGEAPGARDAGGEDRPPEPALEGEPVLER